VRYGIGDRHAPAGMALNEINQQARIEVDHSQELLSSVMAASISSVDRRA
jgi:hypothetical protein